MIWDLPVSVTIDGEEYKIRNNCDYRVVLDVIAALKDVDLTNEEKLECALIIFYEDLAGCKDIETAINEMMRIINNGDASEEANTSSSTPVMDWEHDFKVIAPAISRIIGYDVRAANIFTHWWSFVGAYMEIGESVFANIVSIRKKKQKGKKLEQWELNFYRDNRKLIDLPQKLTEEEKQFLDSDW